MAIFEDTYFVSYSTYYCDDLVYIGNLVVTYPSQPDKTNFLNDVTNDISGDYEYKQQVRDYFESLGDRFYEDDLKVLINSVAKL